MEDEHPDEYSEAAKIQHTDVEFEGCLLNNTVEF